MNGDNGKAEVVLIATSRSLLEECEDWRGPLWMKAVEDETGWQFVFSENDPDSSDD